MNRPVRLNGIRHALTLWARMDIIAALLGPAALLAWITFH
jgi:hypothetical protein